MDKKLHIHSNRDYYFDNNSYTSFRQTPLKINSLDVKMKKDDLMSKSQFLRLFGEILSNSDTLNNISDKQLLELYKYINPINTKINKILDKSSYQSINRNYRVLPPIRESGIMEPSIMESETTENTGNNGNLDSTYIIKNIHNRALNSGHNNIPNSNNQLNTKNDKYIQKYSVNIPNHKNLYAQNIVKNYVKISSIKFNLDLIESQIRNLHKLAKSFYLVKRKYKEIDNRCELYYYKWYNNYLQLYLEINVNTIYNYSYGVTKKSGSILCDSKYYKIRRNDFMNIVFKDNYKIEILNIDNIQNKIQKKLGERIKSNSYLQIMDEVFATLFIPLKYDDNLYNLLIDQIPDNLRQIMDNIDVNFNE